MMRPPVTPAHEWQARFAHEHRPVEVDAHHALPEFEVEFVPGGGLEDGGVVDEDVYPPQFAGYPGAHLVDNGRVADVERPGNGRFRR